MKNTAKRFSPKRPDTVFSVPSRWQEDGAVTPHVSKKAKTSFSIDSDFGQAAGCRVKTYRVGNSVEVEIYPFWDTKCRQARAARQQESRPAQKNLNDRWARRNAQRIILANFGAKDTFTTLTYDNVPPSFQEAKKELGRYLNRVEYHAKKAGVSLKCFVVTEVGENGHIHHHMFSNVKDRDMLENLWKAGGRTQSRRIVADDYGIAGLAIYTAKARKADVEAGRVRGEHRYTRRGKLKPPPQPTVSDTKLSRRQAGEMARDIETLREMLEKKLYPGCRIRNLEEDVEVYFSEYVSGAYIYARLYTSGPPSQTKGGKTG